jgi:hypothetical protein
MRVLMVLLLTVLGVGCGGLPDTPGSDDMPPASSGDGGPRAFGEPCTVVAECATEVCTQESYDRKPTPVCTYLCDLANPNPKCPFGCNKKGYCRVP